MTGRTRGSQRKKRRLRGRAQLMSAQGMRIASVNVAGVSAFKLFIILEKLHADVICL